MASSGKKDEKAADPVARRDAREERMGWLTESAILPRTAKDIKVDHGTVLDLKAALYQKEAEVKSGDTFSRAKVRRPDLFAQRNRGVTARNERDKQHANRAESAAASQALQKKAQIYNKLVNAQSTTMNYLVDFEKKGWDLEDSGGNNGTSSVLNSLPGPLSLDFTPARGDSDAGSGGLTDMEKRAQWEKEALAAMESDELGPAMRSTTAAGMGRPDNGVKQGYQHTLTSQEKEYLKEVTEQTQGARAHQLEVRNKRKLALERRRRLLQDKANRKRARNSAGGLVDRLLRSALHGTPH